MTRRVGTALTLMMLVVCATTASASASVIVRGGHAAVKMTCVAGSAHACTGTMTLRRKAGERARFLGRERYSVAPGHTKTIRIRLNAVALRLLEQREAVGATLRWKTRGARPLEKGVRLRRS